MVPQARSERGRDHHHAGLPAGGGPGARGDTRSGSERYTQPEPALQPDPEPEFQPDPERVTGADAQRSPTATPTPTSSPTSTQPGGPAPPRAGGSGHAARAAAAPPVVASAAAATLTAGSAGLAGLSFDGVADVPTANGTVPMLKFSMSSLSLTGGAQLTVTEGGHQLVAAASALGFQGHVTLLTTSFSGDLLGVKVTFTPQNPPPLMLPVMLFTNVVTAQPYTSADSVDENGLQISSG